MAAKISLVVEAGPHAGVSRSEIARRVRAIMSALQLDNAEVSIVLTGDSQIHELNKLYRGKDKPTDVLAFAQREGEFASLAGDLLGDVIVSVPTARRQANQAKRPLLAELTMLLAHGILHLLGWDHDTAAKDKKMRAETDRLCAAAETGASPRAPKKTGRAAAKRASKRTPPARK